MSSTLEHSHEAKDLYANIYFHLLGRYVHRIMGQEFVKELRLVGAEERLRYETSSGSLRLSNPSAVSEIVKALRPH
jgi:hypothetical protein